MTVMAAEAGTGAVEAEGAEASAATRSTTRAAPAAARGSQRAGGRTPPGTGPATRAALKTSSLPRKVVGKTPQARVAKRAVVGKTRQPPSRARRVATSKPAKKLTGNYHGVVFIEFVLAVILAAGTPLAKKNKTGVSPYAGIDMVKLLAITAVYFLLALTATTGRTQARFAAWFGGLILLAVGLNEAAHIATAVSEFFNPGPQSPATAQPQGNASVVNAGSTAPTGLSRPVAQEPGTGLT